MPKDQIDAPSIPAGSLSNLVERLIAASNKLGNSRIAWIHRSWCLPVIHDALVDMRECTDDPLPRIQSALEHAIEYLANVSNELTINEYLKAEPAKSESGNNVQIDLHYGQLWERFSNSRAWIHSGERLTTRLKRNGFSKNIFEGKKVLDAGCGFGRLAFAMDHLGAERVIGLDVSKKAIETAIRFKTESSLDSIFFINGSIHDLPFDDESFDITFSMGVIHHMPDWETGLCELIRVTRKNGDIFLMNLNNDPGGLYWDVIDIMRIMMNGVEHKLAQDSLSILGLSGDQIIHILDHVLVPVNHRFKSETIEKALEKNAVTKYKRFNRGCDNDSLEQIYQNMPYAKTKYGIGEHIYWAKK